MHQKWAATIGLDGHLHMPAEHVFELAAIVHGFSLHSVMIEEEEVKGAHTEATTSMRELQHSSETFMCSHFISHSSSNGKPVEPKKERGKQRRAEQHQARAT